MANGNGAAKPNKIMWPNLFSRENGLVVLLCLIIILLIIVSSDSSPQWIYQAF